MMKDEGGDELSFLGIGMCIQTGLIEKKRGKNFGPCYYFLIDLGLASFFLYQIGGGGGTESTTNGTRLFLCMNILSLSCFRRRR